MIRSINKQKRGSVSQTMMYFVAIPIILMCLIGLFVFTTSALAQKKLFGWISLPWLEDKEGNEIEIEEGLGALAIQRSMERILNTEVDFNNEKISIYNLIDENDLENKDAATIFNRVANEEFLKDFNYPHEEWEGGAHPWWIRVYNRGDRINRGIKPNFDAGEGNCNPEDPGDSIVTEIRIGEKKLVSCLIKSYYGRVK